MNRQTRKFTVDEDFISKLSFWAAKEKVGFCFKGDGWGDKINFQFDAFAGVGVESECCDSIIKAASFVDDAKDYVIAHLSYDLKNEFEDLESNNRDHIRFPSFSFFVPKVSVLVRRNQAEIGTISTSPESVFKDILNVDAASKPCFVKIPSLRSDFNRYTEKLKRVKTHLQRGDIYQANICHEMYWEQIKMDSATMFNRGYEANPNPFSVFLKHASKHCLCWSPERFLSFDGQQLLSQPMKGTASRGKDEQEDDLLKNALLKSEKDRRENVMIVDMVRNDLSHSATPGSVEVPELYTVNTYPHVHQMISTVTAKKRMDVPAVDALLKCFPMGSMTGAPKIRAMQIIEEIEDTKRGLFSGSIGFFLPDQRYDFNVVIRSILYNEEANYASAHVGGGITILSDIKAEFEESLTKLQPMKDLMNSNG